MSKYSKEALGVAEYSVAMVVAASMPTVPVGAIATAVSDSLTRAPWWEEAEVGYEFRQGEPYRVELSSGVASEHTTTHIYTIHTNSQSTYFRDTRWTPPTPPLAVGDLIDTVAQAESLPVGTIAVSTDNAAFRKVGVNEWRWVEEEICQISNFEMASGGDRIIYLPRGDSE